MTRVRRTWQYEVEELFASSDRAAALVEQAMTEVAQEGTLAPGTPLAWRTVWERVQERLANAELTEHNPSTTTPAPTPEKGDDTQ